MTYELLSGVSGGTFFDWLLGAVVTIIAAISSAVVYLYKDNKADRKDYHEKLERIMEKSNAAIEMNARAKEKNDIALYGLTKAIEELRADIKENRRLNGV